VPGPTSPCATPARISPPSSGIWWAFPHPEQRRGPCKDPAFRGNLESAEEARVQIRRPRYCLRLDAGGRADERSHVGLFSQNGYPYDDEEAATLRVSASRPPTRMNASAIAAFWTSLGPYAPPAGTATDRRQINNLGRHALPLTARNQLEVGVGASLNEFDVCVRRP
jgi:hypothetical protein